MDSRRQIIAILVVVLLVGAIPALAAVADYAAPIEGEVPVSTDQTPTAVVAAPDGSELNLVDMWEGDQLNISTPEGRMIVSGDPGASFRVAVDDIEGSQTQVTEIDAGGSWIELDPADKNRVDVRGDANTLAFSQIGVDDGSTDIQVSGTQGGFAELRLHGLAGNTQYALYDASRDEVLGTLTTDSTGTGAGSVELPAGTHALQVRTAGSFGAPAVSNPTPTGAITERPQNLSVDVSAAAYPVDVTFTLEGETVGSTTLTADGTATVDVSNDATELGAYNWSATATDAVGDSDSVDASFETPSVLTLREEHDPQDLVTNASTTLRFFTVDGDVAIERSVDNGTVDLEGLPNTEFVAFVQSPNHYDRTIYVSSIFEQQSMFLLNETEVPRDQNEAVRSRFIFEDLTGDFPRADTTVQVQRAIDVNDDGVSEYRTVAGDYWGASNEYESVFQYGVRYRLVLVNRETGQRNLAGTHIPTEELTQTIRVSGLVVEAANASGVTGLAELDSQNGTIDIAYADPAADTDSLEVTVQSRGGGDVLFNETVAGPVGTYARSVPVNDSQADQDWVVVFDGGERHQSVIPVGAGSVAIPFPVPGWVLTVLVSMGVTFVGALYGPRTAILGAWSMVFVAAGAAMFGWAFGPASVVIATLIAVGATLLSRALPG